MSHPSTQPEQSRQKGSVETEEDSGALRKTFKTFVISSPRQTNCCSMVVMKRYEKWQHIIEWRFSIPPFPITSKCNFHISLSLGRKSVFLTVKSFGKQCFMGSIHAGTVSGLLLWPRVVDLSRKGLLSIPSTTRGPLTLHWIQGELSLPAQTRCQTSWQLKGSKTVPQIVGGIKMPVTEILKFYKETEASRVGLCRQAHSLFQMVFCFGKSCKFS